MSYISRLAEAGRQILPCQTYFERLQRLLPNPALLVYVPYFETILTLKYKPLAVPRRHVDSIYSPILEVLKTQAIMRAHTSILRRGLGSTNQSFFHHCVPR